MYLWMALLVGVLAAVLITRQITRPLRDTMVAVEKIASGDLTQHLRVTRRDELGVLQQGIARMGTKSQGQGHETTWAQIIATEIGIPADNIMVEEGNTDTAPYGLGTYGSRSTPVAGAAIAMAARKIKAKAQMIAAYKLEVHEDDLEWDIDGFRVKGLPEKFLGMKDICWIAYNSPPPGMEPGLQAARFFQAPKMTYPYGTHAAVVEVDVDTGVVTLLRYAIAYDIGKAVNPMIVDGQLVGALGQGIGGALLEELAYDEQGQLLTTTFMDYLLPTAQEMPASTVVRILEETPTPLNPLGAKGAGEGGSSGCGAAIATDSLTLTRYRSL